MSQAFRRPRRVHFVGIGGVGMSGLAEILLTLGHTVTGSDLRKSRITERLERLGARVFLGHDAAHVAPDTDVVVISSAVKYSNPEVLRARELSIPVVLRGEMLADLLRLKHSVVVGGSHGKTTTTSLIGTILAHAGLDPTAVVGGVVQGFGSNVRLGRGEVLVVEADESDGSFLLLSPTIAVVTNIDPEHLDYYGDLEQLKNAFLQFANRVPFEGCAVLCLDHPNVRAILPAVRKRVVTYGTSADAEWRAEDVAVRETETTFRVRRRGRLLGSVRLGLPGRHHATNAVAALVVASELGVPFEVSAEALGRFSGIHRRFELCGEANGVLVVSDYAHHPAEIAATLGAAREGFARRLVVAFQPHRFTRTRDLFYDFLSAFDAADVLVLTEIYGAGEAEIPGVQGEALYHALRRRGHVDVHFEPDRTGLLERVLALVRPGDLLLVLGAGDIHELAADVLVALGARPSSDLVQ
ncbi:MAG: UDP-N-acetylmuramate--L-alanine ligase [Candidatus Binatia bacterium]|nr:MAG: UDP-N-acetylmuramate--L-alanine ligase [Candidatus Binatia bacterium]